MAIRRHYPGYTKPTPFSAVTFRETTQIDKWFSRWPDTTSRLKAIPQYYQYYSKPLGFSSSTFAESIHTFSVSPVEPRFIGYRPAIIVADNESFSIPDVPTDWMTQGKLYSRMTPGRLVNYMGQASIVFISSGKIHNLPLMGMG